jgi:hypothetical protein
MKRILSDMERNLRAFDSAAADIFSARAKYDSSQTESIMVSLVELFAFLNTVRTERFDQVLSLRSLVPAIGEAAPRAGVRCSAPPALA